MKVSIHLAIVLLTSQFCFSQSNITATVSQQGSVSYRITRSGNYIYISQEGSITGYGSFGGGSITYDYKGRVDKIGTTTITYDYKGRIDGLGGNSISYDYKGRVDKVGNNSITYDYKDRLDKIGNYKVTYDYKGRVDKIGEANITYDYKGRVGKIDENEGMIIFRPEMSEEQ